jgi:hypothetical protein
MGSRWDDRRGVRWDIARDRAPGLVEQVADDPVRIVRQVMWALEHVWWLGILAGLIPGLILGFLACLLWGPLP